MRLNGGKRQPSANVDFARKVKMELGSQTLNDAGSHNSYAGLKMHTFLVFVFLLERLSI